MDNTLITVADKAMPNLVRVKWKKGGDVPAVLQGLYTGYTMAKKDIDTYLALKPIHEAQEYAHQKKISDEEEARLYAEVQKKVDEENKELEAKANVKEEDPKTKNKSGAKHVRKGIDNRGESTNVS